MLIGAAVAGHGSALPARADRVRAADVPPEMPAASARMPASRHRAALLERQSVRDAAKLRGTEAREGMTAERIDRLAARRAATARRIGSLSATLAAVRPAQGSLHAVPRQTVATAPGAAAVHVASTRAAGIAAADRDRAELRRARAGATRLDAALGSARTRLAAEHAHQVAKAGLIERTEREAQAAAPAASPGRAASVRDAAAHAAHAGSLADAIAALARAQRATDAAPSSAAAQPRPRGAAPRKSATAAASNEGDDGAGLAAGAMAPVTGPVVGRFGAPTDAGPASGVSYAPPPAALVRSPCGGQVVFAAPFRSYGQTVIVDCGRSWRVVLAGLAAADAGPGAHVHAGEPVGRMPDWTPGTGGRPTLYLQLRHGSDVIDPDRYLR